MKGKNRPEADERPFRDSTETALLGDLDRASIPIAQQTMHEENWTTARHAEEWLVLDLVSLSSVWHGP